MLTMSEVVFTGFKFQPDECALSGVRYGSVSHTALQAYKTRVNSGHSATVHCCSCGSPTRSDGGQLACRLVQSSWRKFRAMDRVQMSSLIGLVVQSSLLALTTRYSRVAGVDDNRYLTSTAVVTSEFIKVILCLAILAVTAKKTVLTQLSSITNRRDIIRSCVPSLLYTLQNNLQFVAMNYLDAATFQITYQLKILTTAVFSVCVLRKRLDAVHWSALVLLALGVAMVQLPPNPNCLNGTSKETCDSLTDAEGRGSSSLVGVAAVLAMCLSSGFAGVYTEKLLKGTNNTESMWAVNLQLAVTSTVLGLVYVYTVDGTAVATRGFFQDYDLVTWCIVLQLAVLGLVISLVMKHLDNLIKGFASSIAIIITTFISALVLHDLQLSCSFLLGTVVVLGSVLLYNVDRSGDNGRPESVV